MNIAEFDYDGHEIERALFFLSNALQDSGNNTKPVLLHSIQVAKMLWERGYPQDIVIAAVLHDVVEDTDTTIEEVAQRFGQQVASYVDSLTVSEVQDIKQSFARTDELGKDVLAIRAADLIQNSFYYHLAPIDTQKKLKSKFIYFVETYSSQLTDSLADELQSAYITNVKNLPR